MVCPLSASSSSGQGLPEGPLGHARSYRPYIYIYIPLERDPPANLTACIGCYVWTSAAAGESSSGGSCGRGQVDVCQVRARPEADAAGSVLDQEDVHGRSYLCGPAAGNRHPQDHPGRPRPHRVAQVSGRAGAASHRRGSLPLRFDRSPQCLPVPTGPW